MSLQARSGIIEDNWQLIPFLNVKYGPEDWEYLDQYRTPGNSGVAVVWFHGGGGVIGTNDIDVANHPFDAFRNAKQDVVSVKYGLSDEGATYPKQQISAGRAIKWCYDEGYTKVVVFGNSWGGMIAGLATLDADKAAIKRADAQVLWGVPTDFWTVTSPDASGSLPAYFTGNYSGVAIPHSTLTESQLKSVSMWWIAESGQLHVPTFCSYYRRVGVSGEIFNPHDGYYAQHIIDKMIALGETNTESENTSSTGGILAIDASGIANWIDNLG
jgi:pimeloyl-ACP methyl ester carboxylesterase